MRGLGDIFGFIAGWAVLLDFTIDITLFAWTCVDYLEPALPALVELGPSVAALRRGARARSSGSACSTSSACARARRSTASSRRSTWSAKRAILFFGFLFAFRPQLLVHTMQMHWPTPFQLMLGMSLAIISFVGLESISQAAQETQRPASIIPRTSIALILTILIFALAYSNLALGMQPWHPIARRARPSRMQFWQIFPQQRRQSRQSGRAARRAGPVFRRDRRALRPGARRGPAADLVELRRLRQLAHRLRDEPAATCCRRSSSACTPKFRTPASRSSSSAAIAILELLFAACPSLYPDVDDALRALLPRRKRARLPRRSLRLRRGDQLLVRLPRR